MIPGVGAFETLVILAVAFVALGPQRLRILLRRIAHVLSQLREEKR